MSRISQRPHRSSQDSQTFRHLAQSPPISRRVFFQPVTGAARAARRVLVFIMIKCGDFFTTLHTSGTGKERKKLGAAGAGRRPETNGGELRLFRRISCTS